MSKRYTVDETWELCLKMWKWVSEECDRDSYCDGNRECPPNMDCVDCPLNSPVNGLKEKWFEANDCQFVLNDCFFCDLTKNELGNSDCLTCQLRIVGEGDSCTMDGQNYENNPKSFYAELKRLNKIRLEGSKK